MIGVGDQLLYHSNHYSRVITIGIFLAYLQIIVSAFVVGALFAKGSGTTASESINNEGSQHAK